ncbi:stonustoxin subunit beta-like [Oreochromis niloticus]|uniref:stonustoxin subunit beta-like n=1 Tax=Oreochromis niloticus TaxID=8128 RepID=UPI000905914B|nr:stonustoxin subunit beta-like [Oreochromis niloticus]CAI5684793.1 unnamed protein product [Mustela putorius furo]
MPEVSQQCQLHTRSGSAMLSGCLITEEGCASLASALSSNPSYLRELDLRNDSLQDSGVNLLLAGLEDPYWRLDILRVDSGGEQRVTLGLRKFACELTLDLNTTHKNLKLFDNNRRVKVLKQQQPYLDHPEKFDIFCQVLCKNGLAGRCYWEVEWKGKVDVAVTHRGIPRKGYSRASRFGGNDQSWCLTCSDYGYSVWHNDRETSISSSSISNRVAVFVDCPAGTLSFYRVSSDTLIHLHTVPITFSQLLYPGFRVWDGSVTLCSVTESDC